MNQPQEVNPLWIAKEVPSLVDECCAYLEQLGFEDEGIFRVTGSFKDISLIKQKYANGDTHLNLSEYSAYTVAGVITHFFNESKEPIFPYELYDLCIECMEMTPVNVRDECIRHMLQLLPPGNYVTISRFIRLLYVCSLSAEVNKMSCQNLAIALSPTMLRPKVETIETLIQHGDTLAALVCLLIEKPDHFFKVRPGEHLPSTVPDSFVQLFQKSKNDIEERLPPGFLEKINKEKNSIPEEEKPIARVQALWRGYITRKKLIGMNKKYQIAYNRATWDLIMRESNFTYAMKRAIRDFETQLGDNKAGKRIQKLKSIQSNASSSSWQAKNAEAEVKSIVSGFKAIIEVHQMLFEELNELYNKTWPRIENVGRVIIQKLPLYIVYNMYVEMFCRVDKLQNVSDANPDLAKWLNIQTGSGSYSRSLRELLRLPFQHLLGYRVPMQEFVNTVQTYRVNITDTNNVVKSFAVISRIGTAIESIDNRLNFQIASILESSLLGFDKNGKSGSLASMERKFIRKGPITVDGVPSYIFLFSDICIVGKQPKDTYVYSFQIKLKNCTLEDNSRNGFILHTKVKNEDLQIKFVSKTPEQKIQFYIDFQRILAHWKSDVFGVPPEDIIRREGKTEKVPKVVISLVNEILHIADSTGDYQFICLGSDAYSSNSLKMLLNTCTNYDEFDYSKYEPRVIVDTLKLFLLELPTPLINKDNANNLFTDRTERSINLVNFRNIIQSSPPSTRDLIEYIANFFTKTGIHPSTLAQIWGHTIYRGLNQTVSEALQLEGVTTVVRALIINTKELCDVNFNPQIPNIPNLLSIQPLGLSPGIPPPLSPLVSPAVRSPSSSSIPSNRSPSSLNMRANSKVNSSPNNSNIQIARDEW